jgi:hypothetical protein
MPRILVNEKSKNEKELFFLVIIYLRSNIIIKFVYLYRSKI